MFIIELSRKAQKQFDSIKDEKITKTIRVTLKCLEFDPVPAKNYDVKKLEGLEDTFRIRLGKIRIVYTILWKEKAIIVSRIEKRGTVFD